MEPWKTLKEDRRRCSTTIHLCIQAIRSLAILCEPIIPFASQRMWTMLNLPGAPLDAGWESAAKLELNAGHQLGRPEILFTKIEDEVIQRHIDSLGKISLDLKSQTTNLKPPTPNLEPRTSNVKPQVTIDNFKQLDLRIAKVIAAERVPKSDKLLKLQVSLGEETRQVIAGIAQHYKPEDLIGKKIVVVANLAPAKLMGQASEGMLLSASNSDGKLTILTCADDIDEGSIVK